MLTQQVLLVAVSAIIAVNAQISDQQGNRWVWGRRESSNGFQPALAQRRSASIRNNDFHRSITARIFPRLRALNYLNTVRKEGEREIGNDEIRPSPVDISLIRTNEEPETIPQVVTPGLFPYPFGQKPVVLGDGTSIGYSPQDTLSEGPITNGHQQHHTQHLDNKQSEDEIDDERYTTLDKISRLPEVLPDPHSLSPEILGGLNPDEVYYADKDLVIIKGGGFHNPNEIVDFSNDRREQSTAVRPEPFGNELGEETINRERPTEIRPRDIFRDVPLPFAFVNGNIPAIVKPPTANQGGSKRVNAGSSYQQDLSFRPLHQNRFAPDDSRYSFASAASNNVPTVYRFENEPISINNIQPQRYSNEHAAQKRSTNSKVVHYHYQSRGNSNAPIVNYQIHANGVTTNNNNIGNAAQRTHQNQIPTAVNKQTKPVLNVHNNYHELEDLSTPTGQNNLIPTVQTSKPGPINQQQHISLEGDTRVNYLHPIPPRNPLAEHVFNKPAVQTIPAETHPNVTALKPVAVLQNGRPGTGTRFMEPRRRRPIRRQTTSPRL